MSKRAGAVSAETKERILQAARDEFSARGFQGSSLRRICSAAGVTTGALYFFFEGKDDLFETVISSVTEPFTRFMQQHYREEAPVPRQSPEDNADADVEIGMVLIDFYFRNRQVWDILLAHLSHPSVRAFLDNFVDYSTDHYMKMLQLAEQAQPRKTPIDRFALHQFVHMQTDTMLTLVSHDFSREEMRQHSETVTKMLRGAFQALLSD